MPDRIPVIALTGYLGAGKTTVLNNLLQQPGARVGVVVNDFGAVNVDAALVSGQVDEPVSIAGGCLCCVADDETLDDALRTLAQPRLALDVIVVEASGVAEPAALARRIRFSEVRRIRPAGVVDVVDAVEYFATVDTAAGSPAPSRFAAATLVVLNKCDRLAPERYDDVLARIEGRVLQSNSQANVVRAHGGRVDARLLFDAAAAERAADQLPFAEPHPDGTHEPHQPARAATVTGHGPADAGRLADLLENPPAGAYRLKGRVTVRTGTRAQRYVVNLVGHTIHLRAVPAKDDDDNHLVAIGHTLDVPDAQRQLEHALAPVEVADGSGRRRLQRLVRLSD